MKTIRTRLAMMAVLLCSITQIHAVVKTYDDWTSDNQDQDGTTSTKIYNIEAPAGATLSFDWSVSSESGYDKLTVVLDSTNVLVDGVSGESSGTYSNEIAMGKHVLVVTYSKDDSSRGGDDQATLSNIKVEAPDVAEIDGVSYVSTGSNTVIIAGVADTTEVVIPSTVVINDTTYNVTELSEKAFDACLRLAKVTIPEGITEIKATTFENCQNLSSVTLPNTLTSIGNSAFKGCHSLTEIVIPDSVTFIGESAFEVCGSLSSVTLPSSLTSIGQAAFKNCISLSNISDIPNTVTSIANGVFEGCVTLTSITLPDSLTTIGSSAFKGCTILSSIAIPNTVTSVGEGAFQACTSLAEISLPNGVTYIYSRTFSDCINLVSIDLPKNLTQIGSYAFYDCGNMQTMTIPASVSWIGDNAFTGCGGEQYIYCQTPSYWGGSNGAYYGSKITKITIGAGITDINQYAFYGCRNLSEVILPNTVTTIGQYAFGETNLSTIELPAGIISFYDDAFPSSMSKMTCNAVTPPTLLNNNGNTPSLGNISTIHVPQGCGQAYKSVNPWASKAIIDGSGVTVNVTVTPGMMGDEILKQISYLADVNFLTLSGAINETDIANIKNSMPNLVAIDMSGLDMKSIPSAMFWERKALLSIILPNNIETIGAYAFNGCINLESIVLPEGLKRIEDGNNSAYINGQHYGTAGSFSNCRSLKSISFPSTLENVANYAFYGCNRLQKVEFKEGVTSIGSWAFASCSSLTNITLPNSLKSISAAAFYNCNSLRNVIIPAGVTSIGYLYEASDWYENETGAFENCSSLKQIILPKGLQDICQRTFSGCSSLTHVTIPEGVTFIGHNAFQGCSNLLSVSLPSTLAACSSTPFANCNKLTEVSCLALFPPTLTDGLLTLENMGLALKRTLKVPEWTINRYKLTSGWAAFTQMEPIVGVYPSTISVVGDAVLTMPTAGLPSNYKPDMVFSEWYNPNQMMAYGDESSLHLRGAGTLELSNFDMNSGYQASMKQLLNEEATVTADKVNVSMYLDPYDNYDSRAEWNFLSFPFDVKLSDVITNCDWVVRQYDGKARANNKLNNTWVTVPHDATLKAGQGYIWASSGGSFTLPAVDNANKNNIFAYVKREQPLQEYAAELVSNSSWNLVGNPFPCYYNTNEMDYTAPITVWDSQNNTYTAYSPVDDSYVLRPFEAFFVQCPAGVKNIGFKPEGRQLDRPSTPSTPPMPASPSRNRNSKSERQVINLVLSNENTTDRTRIVINNDAKMDYELTCDAAKFMSDDTNMPQIYSVSNGEMFAINERPMGNGVVKLGTHFSVTGTYTIAMQSASNMVVVLVDHKTGVKTDLTVGDYTFNAEAGDSDRFEVRMYADEETTSIDAVEADTKVLAVGNVILVTTSADTNVELYNAAGSLIAVGQGKNMTFDAAQGMYIVKVNGVSHKVAVVK